MAQISIIVPVYNAENTVAQCLDSILALEYKDYEVIVVDDGSQDSSYDICKQYASKDRRIKLFHKKNGGVSSARNLGLRECNAPWITFVDSDDMVSKDYLNGVVDCSEDLLIVGYWNLSPDGKQFGSKHVPNSIVFPIVKDFISHNMSSFEMRGPVCKFYRYELIKGILFREDMKVAEDACLVMEYLKNVKNMKILPDRYYIVRNHGTNASQRYKTTVLYAANSLSHLRDAIDGLVDAHGISRAILFPYISFFKASSKDDWHRCPSKWYENKVVLSIYKYVWTDLPIRQKIRLLCAYILKR